MAGEKVKFTSDKYEKAENVLIVENESDADEVVKEENITANSYEADKTYRPTNNSYQAKSKFM